MFSLYARLAAAAVVAVALAMSHWKAYRSGQDAITADWQADIAQRTAAALEASEAARKRESELLTKVGRVDRAYQDQKRATATVAAAVAVGMRELETALAAPAVASSDAVATTRDHGTGGLERELLGHCARTVQAMAGEAQRLQGKVVTLQAYIREIHK